MNTLSSLPPTGFGNLAFRSVAPPEAHRVAPDDTLQTLHVSAGAQARPLDDIERDFLDALCQSHPA